MLSPSVSRSTRVVALTSAVVLLTVATVPASASASTASQSTMREHLYLLAGYLERYANEHYGYYPEAAQVKKGRLTAPVWPTNPWTGAPMTSGQTSGTFTYRLREHGLAFTLVGHTPNGNVTVRRTVPWTRKMQNDHRSTEGIQLVQRYVDQWIVGHNGELPPREQVAADGAVGRQRGVGWWPHDPWTHEPMRQGTGWSQFTYVPDRAGGTYTIVLHSSRGAKRTLRGPQAWTRFLTSTVFIADLPWLPVHD